MKTFDNWLKIREMKVTQSIDREASRVAGFVNKSDEEKCSDCGRLLGDYHKTSCRYRKSQYALTGTGNDRVKPNHCK
jgi:hypothetical protein